MSLADSLSTRCPPGPWRCHRHATTATQTDSVLCLSHPLSTPNLAAAGTASFTSIRRGKDGRFEVLRWKITRDDGAVLDLTGLDLTKPLEGVE